MESEKIEKIEHFINNVIISQLGMLQQTDATFISFVAMGQAIEVMGSLLDNKPMKAKGQSSKRFNACINYLLGGGYRIHNENMYLYDKLRNQMVHTFIPSGDILLIREKDNLQGMKHLTKVDGRLVLISEQMYADICKAAQRLCSLLHSGKVKAKNIGFE
ncbi:MAG: hypothetical protein ACRDDZ_02430 [Marinifilaceae bacterium]